MSQAVMVGNASGGIGLLLAFVFSLYPLYYQSHLNGLWDRYLQPSSAPLRRRYRRR